jgi:hypothetical protein
MMSNIFVISPKLVKVMEIFRLLILFLVYPSITFAYCPLCVGGVLVLTFLGYEIGVKRIVLGFLIGALAVAFAEWLNRLIKIKLFKGQDFLIIALTFILIYLPVKNYIFNYYSLYFPNLGVHTPILIDKSLLSGIFGGLLVYIAPFISKFITQKRGKTILFQRIIVTLILLIIFGLILQFI